jgi:hypothetical protein
MLDVAKRELNDVAAQSIDLKPIHSDQSLSIAAA